MNHVIAIAAPIGGGKTSLAQAVAAALGDAALLFHDHYESATGRPVDDLVQWLENGADFNAFRLPGLADDLKRLKQGQPVVDPLTRREIRPGKFIVFEMPLGRAHAETAPHIDLLLWIDVPLDIALARKLREFIREILQDEQPGACRDRLLWVEQYIAGYVGIVHDVLSVQRDKVRPGADIIIDGRKPMPVMAAAAVESIRRRLASEANPTR